MQVTCQIIFGHVLCFKTTSGQMANMLFPGSEILLLMAMKDMTLLSELRVMEILC